ncbi:MAG: hypothetical protein H6538_03280 [Bacteroidales bacterium]|nr:hypothetical protein [Bacteroidales bacterium]MCB9013337.1 hypothetical protein [Bacteroidales bacterium]
MKSTILIIILSILPIIAKSQDKLYLKDGRVINCHVTKLDSLNCYYILENTRNPMETMIQKKEILYLNISDEKPANKIKPISSKRNRIDFSMGFSIPRNDFASDDIFKEESGYAGNGLSFNVNYAFLIVPKFGFFVKGINYSNEYHAEIVGKALSYLYSLPVENNTVKYKTNAIIFGPEFVYPVERLTFEGHAGIGFARLKEPEVTYSISYGSISGWIKKSSITASAVLYTVGGGLIYNLTDRWQILGNADFHQGSFKFEKNILTGASGETASVPPRKQYCEVWTAVIGLGLKF